MGCRAMKGRERIKPYGIMYQAIKIADELIERFSPEDDMLGLKSFMHNGMAVLDRTLRQADEGKPIVGYHFAFPADIIHCFDVVPFNFEAVPYTMSSVLLNGAEHFYDRITAFGHPYHACTSQKGIMGFSLEGMVDYDLVLCPTAPCDNTIASYQFFSNHMKVPLLIADMPYYRTESAYEFFAGELWKNIEDMSTILNQEPNWDGLKAAVNNNTKAQEYLIEINEMRRYVPCPIESITVVLITMATVSMPGTPEKVQFFKDLRDLMQKRIKNNEGRTGFEKFRSIWPNISLFYDLGLYEWMDRVLGMSYIMDVFNHYYYEPIKSNDIDKILLGIAKQAMNYPMTHQAQSFVDIMVEDTLRAARDYKADCAIMTGHLGCKQVASIIQILREILRDELDIPMLTIEVDIGDKRFASIETVKYEIAEFTKTLLE